MVSKNEDVTTMNPHKANLFLVGAMKAATTSLFELLKSQEAIYASPIKEPHFFVEKLPKHLYRPSPFFSLEQYFKNQFPEVLHIAHVTSALHYEKLFSLRKQEPYLLEGSTMYLHAPNSAEKIYQYNPDARIIILTRDPLERTFSQYGMMVGLSKEYRTFKTVIEEELELYQKGLLPWHSYIGMSFYTEQIKAYRLLFKNVLVLSFDTFISNRKEVIEQLEDFLEITIQDNSPHKVLNTTRKPKFKRLQFFLTKIRFRALFSKWVSHSWKQRIYRMVTTQKKEKLNLSPEIIKRLKEIFREKSF